ncbi:MAG: ATP-dependent metallopeptidase FtsH/Yme1/Tma family protein, partial [Treponemataceae bacterium]|nr:ATP-dependent metallopeptidase FtsH/Yme1/Tma family protein [Treponemataceae bacterium]
MIQEKEKNKNRGCFTYSLIIMIVISVIYLITSVMNFSNKNVVEYSYSDFLQLVENKTIKEACILDKS